MDPLGFHYGSSSKGHDTLIIFNNSMENNTEEGSSLDHLNGTTALTQGCLAKKKKKNGSTFASLQGNINGQVSALPNHIYLLVNIHCILLFNLNAAFLLFPFTVSCCDKRLNVRCHNNFTYYELLCSVVASN